MPCWLHCVFSSQHALNPLNTLDTNDTVLAFGDSLTFGSDTYPEKSYPAKSSRQHQSQGD
ncbi:MAG: hypothetical protein COB94_010030 [Gammaproteobacteria bacterium]|nr:hypothetical protein [Gammaproteobacteria bacterium]